MCVSSQCPVFDLFCVLLIPLIVRLSLEVKSSAFCKFLLFQLLCHAAWVRQSRDAAYVLAHWGAAPDSRTEMSPIVRRKGGVSAALASPQILGCGVERDLCSACPNEQRTCEKMTWRMRGPTEHTLTSVCLHQWSRKAQLARMRERHGRGRPHSPCAFRPVNGGKGEQEKNGKFVFSLRNQAIIATE
jgi:hypothetical protein